MSLMYFLSKLRQTFIALNTCEGTCNIHLFVVLYLEYVYINQLIIYN